MESRARKNQNSDTDFTIPAGNQEHGRVARFCSISSNIRKALEKLVALPQLEIQVRYVIEYTFRTVRSNPDRFIRQIFGDYLKEQHAALYGNDYLEKIKKWVTGTKIPVVLGYDLSQTQLPCVSINLSSMSPAQMFLGDRSFMSAEPVEQYERTVIVPAFSPKAVTFNDDRTEAVLTLPDSMSDDTKALFLSGMAVIDKKNQEFMLALDDDTGNPKLVLSTNSSPGRGRIAAVTDIDASELKVLTPYLTANYTRGAMYFDNNIVVACHGHQDRIETLWLWMIVMWGLLKYRPLLTQLFGIDLSTPTASDFVKDDSFLGENVWVRTISMSCKTMWEWEDTRAQDLLGLILCIKQDQRQD
jgi:hypothetical protein